jgi:arylsulfatase A-like enzyme
MTQPSHFTMLTGLPPSVHRLVEASGTKILPPAARTLAQELRDAGVATAAATENAAIVLGSGIERGFESYSELRGRAANHKTGDIELTLASARSWLERNGDRRFFLFLHTYEVHTPYAPAASHASLFADEDSGREVPHNIPEDLHPDRYDREIRYTDDTLRSFFAALEEAGWLEDTIVVVTSDHGEAFLEHGYLAHGAELHQELVHIPLMLLGPGITAGQRLQVPLGHADLMPTLLELMNAAAPPVANRTYGRSFAPLLRGETTAAELAVWRRRPVFSEAWRTARFVVGANGAPAMEKVRVPRFAVRVGQRKLIRRRERGRPQYEYYDLGSDPGERNDLYQQDPSAAGDLRRLIDGYVRDTASSAARLGAPEAGGPLEPERAAKLRALGYVE